MAFEEEVSYTGQKSTSTLSAKLRIDEGRGYMVVHDGTDNRLLIGVDPSSGNVVIAISKPGEDVFEALAA